MNICCVILDTVTFFDNNASRNISLEVYGLQFMTNWLLPVQIVVYVIFSTTGSIPYNV